jgi:hypothetical protein
VDRTRSDIELHTAGATVRHESPFAKVVVPVTDERISETLRDKWVIPLYMRVCRGRYDEAVRNTLAPLRDEIDLPVVTTLISYFDWRPRIVGAWLAGLRALPALDDHIGRLLVRSDVCYAGRGLLPRSGKVQYRAGSGVPATHTSTTTLVAPISCSSSAKPWRLSFISIGETDGMTLLKSGRHGNASARHALRTWRR